MSRGLARLPNIEVVDAGSIADAKKLLGAVKPHLVVTDLDLPDGSGVEVISEIAALKLAIPIVVVSAYLRTRRIEIPQRADVDVHEKPISLEQLRKIVLARLGAPAFAPSPFTPSDYVQLAAMGRRSVLLEVRKGGGLRGTIVIRRGEVWDARDAHGQGLDAFRRLVLAPDVVVTCGTPTEPMGPRSVEGSCESVLLEAAQALDEGRVTIDDEADAGLDAAWEPDDPMSFDVDFERGVDALLGKDYRAAFAAFTRAGHARPEDPRVRANLARLRELGFGGDR